MKIVFDIDNTLCNTNGYLKQLGADITIYPNPLYKKEFWTSDKGKEIISLSKPIDKVINLLYLYINEKHDVIIATQRPKELKEITIDWLHNQGINLPVFFITSKEQVNGDIYYEDDPREIQRLLNLGKKVYVPKWEYNKQFKNVEFIRL